MRSSSRTANTRFEVKNLSPACREFHLRPDNVLQVTQDIDDLRATGANPILYIDDAEGLNPHFIRRLLNQNRDRTYLSGLAHQQLHPPTTQPETLRLPVTATIVWIAVTLIAFGSGLYAW